LSSRNVTGEEAAFVSAGGYHHHIGLNTWESPMIATAEGRDRAFIISRFLYPTRAALADALRRLMQATFL